MLVDDVFVAGVTAHVAEETIVVAVVEVVVMNAAAAVETAEAVVAAGEACESVVFVLSDVHLVANVVVAPDVVAVFVEVVVVVADSDVVVSIVVAVGVAATNSGHVDVVFATPNRWLAWVTSFAPCPLSNLAFSQILFSV